MNGLTKRYLLIFTLICVLIGGSLVYILHNRPSANGVSGSEDTTSNSTFPAPTANTTLTNSSSITWTWSDPAHTASSDAKIYIGTRAGGTDIANGTDLGTAQTYTKTGLSDGIFYAYVIDTTIAQVTVGDFVIGSNTTIATSGNSTGSTVDTHPATFGTIFVSEVTTSGATVTWTTSEPATTQLKYGTTSGSYPSSTALDSTLSTSHSLTLTGLTEGTTYYLESFGTDQAGNLGNSTEKSFMTTSQSVPSPSATPSATASPSPTATTTVSATPSVTPTSSSSPTPTSTKIKEQSTNSTPAPSTQASTSASPSSSQTTPPATTPAVVATSSEPTPSAVISSPTPEHSTTQSAVQTPTTSPSNQMPSWLWWLLLIVLILIVILLCLLWFLRHRDQPDESKSKKASV